LLTSPDHRPRSPVLAAGRAILPCARARRPSSAVRRARSNAQYPSNRVRMNGSKARLEPLRVTQVAELDRSHWYSLRMPWVYTRWVGIGGGISVDALTDPVTHLHPDGVEVQRTNGDNGTWSICQRTLLPGGVNDDDAAWGITVGVKLAIYVAAAAELVAD